MNHLSFKNVRNISFYLVLLGLINACVEPYDKAFNLKASPLVIDGFITDQAEGDTIVIKTAKTASTTYAEIPLDGCKAVVIENGGSPVALREFGSGRYVTPVGFRGKIGNSYKLQFITPDGNKYESNDETIIAVPEFQKVYDKFDTKATTNDKGTIFYPASVVYIDTQDPPNERNFYLWRFIHFEKISICATCERGVYNKANETCVDNRGFTYDYHCDGSCWNIAYSSTVNVFSDINSNGLNIKGRVIAKIPYYNYGGCLIEVQQASISSGAYNFYKLLDQQGQSTGSLTDTPPAAIVGNVKNINVSAEPVVGYFGASSIKKIRYWINRNDAVGIPSSVLGHQENLGPPQGLPPTEVYAKCFSGRTRSPFKPNGWIN